MISKNKLNQKEQVKVCPFSQKEKRRKFNSWQMNDLDWVIVRDANGYCGSAQRCKKFCFPSALCRSLGGST